MCSGSLYWGGVQGEVPQLIRSHGTFARRDSRCALCSRASSTACTAACSTRGWLINKPPPPHTYTHPGLGGKLTRQEIAVIQGAMDLKYKTALKAMTPLDKVGSRIKCVCVWGGWGRWWWWGGRLCVVGGR